VIRKAIHLDIQGR